ALQAASNSLRLLCRIRARLDPVESRQASGLVPVHHVDVAGRIEGDAVRRSEDAFLPVVGGDAEIRPLLLLGIVAEISHLLVVLVEDRDARLELGDDDAVAVEADGAGTAEVS